MLTIGIVAAFFVAYLLALALCGAFAWFSIQMTS